MNYEEMWNDLKSRIQKTIEVFRKNIIDYNNNDPTYEIRSRFVRIYLRLFYWIGIAVENENMKKYMHDDLDRMLAMFNNHI